MNTCLVSKLCYILRILFCGLRNVQAFYRLIAFYIRRCNSRPTRRDIRRVGFARFGLTLPFVSRVLYGISFRVFIVTSSTPPSAVSSRSSFKNLYTVLWCHLSRMTQEGFSYFSLKSVIDDFFHFLTACISLGYLSVFSKKMLVKQLAYMPVTFHDEPGKDML